MSLDERLELKELLLGPSSTRREKLVIVGSKSSILTELMVPSVEMISIVMAQIQFCTSAFVIPG